MLIVREEVLYKIYIKNTCTQTETFTTSIRPERGTVNKEKSSAASIIL